MMVKHSRFITCLRVKVSPPHSLLGSLSRASKKEARSLKSASKSHTEKVQCFPLFFL